MKRKSFLAMLFGASAGAVAQDEAVATANTRVGYGNNYCPVCGTPAQPYYRLSYYDSMRSGAPIAVSGTHAGELVCPISYVDDTERITRCTNCSAAFWQDAIERQR